MPSIDSIRDDFVYVRKIKEVLEALAEGRKVPLPQSELVELLQDTDKKLLDLVDAQNNLMVDEARKRHQQQRP